jgi:hypothetical protein
MTKLIEVGVNCKELLEESFKLPLRKRKYAST